MRIHIWSLLMMLGIVGSVMINPTPVKAQLTASQRTMINGCRAGDRNECWRASQYIYNPNPEAREATLKGCELGSRDLCYYAGQAFERDLNAADRLNLAAKYFKLACELGNSDGCARLRNSQSTNGKAAAASILQTNKTRCNSGDGLACNMAGYLLDKSGSGAKENSEALYYYNRGCKLGIKMSCVNVTTVQANANFSRRNVDRKAAELAARNDPTKRPGTELSRSDRSCLQDQQEAYYTTERGQCTSYYAGPNGAEGCARYANIDVRRTRYTIKNICARPISIHEFCGATSFASATLIPGDIYTRSYVNPCRLAN